MIQMLETKAGDWLSERELGLRSPTPLGLKFSVLLLFWILGVVVELCWSGDSLLTVAAITIPASVYEIGRPSLPTREEALLHGT